MSNLFFLKTAPQKKQRATNIKEKNTCFESNIYIQQISNVGLKGVKNLDYQWRV